MKPTPLCLFSALLITAVTTMAAAPNEDATLDGFFREQLETGFRQRPSTATGLGDHRFDDQLDDVSAAARARWTVMSR